MTGATPGRSGCDPAHVTLPVEYPVPAEVTALDIRCAQQAVGVHDAVAWPHGVLCRNCGEVFPCGVHRWGRRVLMIAGYNAAQIGGVVAATRSGHPPWLMNPDARVATGAPDD